MATKATKRPVEGTVSAVTGTSMIVDGKTYTLADRADKREMPNPGQRVRFEAYDYGRGGEAFWNWESPDAPARPAASKPSTVQHARATALLAAAQIMQGSGAASGRVIALAREFEAYLNEPEPAPAPDPQATPELLPSAELTDILTRLQQLGISGAQAPIAAQQLIADQPMRTRRSRQIA